MTNNFDIREWRMKQLLKEAAFDPKKSDINRDGKLSDYEKKRGMAIAKNIKEQPDQMIYDPEMREDDWKQSDDESSMAHGQLANVLELAQKLRKMISNGEQLDAWVQAKLTKAEDYLDSVYHYLQGEEYEHEEEEEEHEEEEEYDDMMSSPKDNVVVGAMFNERRGDTDYKRARDAKRFGKKGEQNTFGAGVAKGERIEKQKLRK